MPFQEHISIKNFNTFGIDVFAKYFVVIDNADALLPIQKTLQKEKCLILGGGSNLLFTKDFDGLIVKINIKGISKIKETKEHVWIAAGAGEVWNDFVQHCVNNNWGGIENLTLIPGTVGASPVQNIGAYGVELKDVMESCVAFEIETGKLKTFSNTECRFSYRESLFKQAAKGKFIITSVIFKLTKNARVNTSYGAIQDELRNLGISKPSISDVSKVVAKIRVSKLPDPGTIGNAGSFFKNPIIPKEQLDLLKIAFPDIVHYSLNEFEEKLAAGWLIEQCCWKGKIVGNTGTWKNQALVLVNHGNASGNEVWRLAQDIIQSVRDKFGILLHPEVNVL